MGAQSSFSMWDHRQRLRMQELARKLRREPPPQVLNMIADELDRLAQG